VVAVGRLFKPWGIRGELGAEVYSSHPRRAEKLKEVVLESAGGKTRASRVERIDSISDAEPWAGSDILVADAERELPEEGEYSHADVLGCVLWNRDERVGLVHAIEDYGGGPLLEVKLDQGGEVLVPFTLTICKEIDVAAKTIRAELPEGLLEK
jgi:16S rRNA processing protein RimM